MSANAVRSILHSWLAPRWQGIGLEGLLAKFSARTVGEIRSLDMERHWEYQASQSEVADVLVTCRRLGPWVEPALARFHSSTNLHRSEQPSGDTEAKLEFGGPSFEAMSCLGDQFQRAKPLPSRRFSLGHEESKEKRN